MAKPFKITFKDGHEPTPEEAEWIRRAEAIINHEENAEPILQRSVDAHGHLLIYGHAPWPLDAEYCAACNVKWTKG